MKKLAALLLTVTLTNTFSQALAQSLPQAARQRIIQATVMLLPANEDGSLQDSLGSGTIISPSGYILTNYHVIGDIENRDVAPWIQVRTIRFVDQQPILSYWGKVVAADPNLDLAIVKIVMDKDQKTVGNLNLPTVQLGDSNTLTLGDPIYVFGFQGTGGLTLTYSSGSVGGFTGDDLVSSGRQWIKHDAQTGPGNSGGGVYDANGDLIGIHSAGVSEGSSRTAFMRPIAVAWGLITPNVPKFAVRPGTAPTQAQTPKTSTQSPKTSSQTSQGSQGSQGSSAMTWPPKISTGQTWGFMLKSDDIEEIWQVKVTGTTAKGTPKGTASSDKRDTEALLYYVGKDDTLWLDLPLKGDSFYSCAFKKSGVKQDIWTGELLYYENADADGESIGACGALLSGAGSSSGSSSGSSTSTSTPSSSNSKLTWPLKPRVGQTWQVQIPKFGSASVKLTKAAEGGATGSATLGKSTLDAQFYYEDKEDTTWLDISDDTSLLYCAFEKGGLKGTTLTGTAYYRADMKSSQDAEKLGSCTAKLN